MQTVAVDPFSPPVPPDHTQLPETDGKPMVNTQEHPQSVLLTDTLRPRLRQLFGAGCVFVGADTGIYWRQTDPPLDGCKAPNWFVVPGVAQLLDGVHRRSYVLWREGVRPFLAIEYVSGDGSEERDTTPHSGKFWVYERGICIPYYLIFDDFRGTLEGWHLVDGAYCRLEPNGQGRLSVPQWKLEFGLWHGTFNESECVWLRAWDAETGEMLPVSSDRADLAEANNDHLRDLATEATEQAVEARKEADDARREADDARQEADDARQQADDARKTADAAQRDLDAEREHTRLLIERLRAAGIEPG